MTETSESETVKDKRGIKLLQNSSKVNKSPTTSIQPSDGLSNGILNIVRFSNLNKLPCFHASFNENGNLLIFSDKSGVFSYSLTSNQHRQLLTTNMSQFTFFSCEMISSEALAIKRHQLGSNKKKPEIKILDRSSLKFTNEIINGSEFKV